MILLKITTLLLYTLGCVAGGFAFGWHAKSKRQRKKS